METAAARPADDPRWLLAHARALAHRVRRDQRASWFALLIFAALTFASVPAVRYGGHHLDCQAAPGGIDCRVFSRAEFVYWPIALILAYALIAAFYIRRSRARGIGTHARPYIVAGVIIAVALDGAAWWELHDPAGSLAVLLGYGPAGWPDRLASPGAAIGLALLVLARAEHSRALAFLTLGYLAAVLVPLSLAGIQSGRQAGPGWSSQPAVLQGCLLLAGGIAFAVAQRPLRARAA